MSWFSRLKNAARGGEFQNSLRELAKAQLTAFYSLQRMYPDMRNEDLYHRVLLKHPGCKASVAESLMEGSKEVAKSTGEPLRFQHVVFSILANETRKDASARFRNAPTRPENPGLPEELWNSMVEDFGVDVNIPPSILSEISNVVHEIIPSRI